jgi:cation diffusion facilitator CzcD-associated flavoprotein CzcO
MTHLHIAILGAGFAGIGMAIKLLQADEKNFLVFERASEVGGTWRDNTYPGCACDVPSHLYSFSFAPNPTWSQTYSEQPEILEYLRQMTKDFGVTPYLRFEHEMIRATWQENASQWLIETNRGTFTSTFLISGHGPLVDPKLPDIPGLNDFAGTTFHSARWNHNHDLSGKRVAVIGTGASAVQFVPRIQPNVAKLSVFQRSAPWIIPRQNRPYSFEDQTTYRRLPLLRHWSRFKIYWRREFMVLGFWAKRQEGLVTRIARKHLEAQVPDPQLRARLTPTYSMGCKRIMVSDDFYPAITQPNVDLVTEGIERITATGILTKDGHTHEVDTIILGTGFNTYNLRSPIANTFIGRDGRTIGETWQGSPEAYLGITVHNFPNFFLLLGPNTALGHSSVLFMLEAQFAYIMKALQQAKRSGYKGLEVRADAQQQFNEQLQRELSNFVWTNGSCSSFYLDDNGKNTLLWPGFTFRYRAKTRQFETKVYRTWN